MSEDSTGEVDIFPKETVVPIAKSYMEEYDSFMDQYKLQEVSAEEIGALIMRMSGYYQRYNLMLVRSLKVYNKKKMELMSQVDATGKPMAVSKADILADATPEAHAYFESKIHVENINQHINSLKALQKGTLQEYAHS